MRHLALALAALCAGCSTTVTLYPVSGPLSQQRPMPVLTATVDGITGNSGPFSVSLPGGNDCRGRWSSMAPQSVSYSSGYASGSVTNGMQTAWGSVYGSGFTIANKPGVNKGEAMAACARGGNIQVEFYTGSGTASGVGVARDTEGNTYKLIF